MLVMAERITLNGCTRRRRMENESYLIQPSLSLYAVDAARIASSRCAGSSLVRLLHKRGACGTVEGRDTPESSSVHS